MIDRCERTDRGSYDHHGTRPRLGKQCHRASTRSCRDNPEGWAPRSRQARFDTSTAGSSPAGSALFFAIWLSASLLSSQAVVSVLCDAPGFARRLESPLDRAYFHRLPSFAPTNLSISQPSPCPPCPLSHILHYFCNGREADNCARPKYLNSAKRYVFTDYPCAVSFKLDITGKACLRCRKRKMVSI